MNNFIFQVRLKKGKNGVNMPTSSRYSAWGVGFHFLSMPSVPVIDAESGSYIPTNVSAFDVALNYEIGRRMVFQHGIVLDFGIVTNLAAGIFGIGSYSDTFDVIDESYVKKQMRTRAALNSLINFKIAVGFLY
jgi:hypothetical protein